MESNQSNNKYHQNSILLFSIPLFILVLIILCLFLLGSLGNNSGTYISTNNNDNNTEKIFRIFAMVLLIFFLFYIIISTFKYFFGINIIEYLKDFINYLKGVIGTLIFESESEKEKEKREEQKSHSPYPLNNHNLPVPSSNHMSNDQIGGPGQTEIFNIPGNYYNYSDAKALCSAYGAELATYKQLENSYQNGAEWCNYGWSEGQMALFPTQQKTFEHLQKIPGHEHDCGRPGVNGGYIANPNVKFGVNCYGKKPKMTLEEENLMNVSTPYPETAEDIAFKKRVDYWKNNIDNILVSPFNNRSWNS